MTHSKHKCQGLLSHFLQPNSWPHSLYFFLISFNLHKSSLCHFMPFSHWYLPPPRIQSSPWRHSLFSSLVKNWARDVISDQESIEIKVLDFSPKESSLGKSIENRLSPGLSPLFPFPFKRQRRQEAAFSPTLSLGWRPSTLAPNLTSLAGFNLTGPWYSIIVRFPVAGGSGFSPGNSVSDSLGHLCSMLHLLCPSKWPQMPCSASYSSEGNTPQRTWAATGGFYHCLDDWKPHCRVFFNSFQLLFPLTMNGTELSVTRSSPLWPQAQDCSVRMSWTRGTVTAHSPWQAPSSSNLLDIPSRTPSDPIPAIFWFPNQLPFTDCPKLLTPTSICQIK